MIGKKELPLDGQTFTQGLSTSDYLPDGGIGTSSTNINLLMQRGVIRASGSATPTGDSFVSQIIASCSDTRLDEIFGRVFLDSGGRYYAVSVTGGTPNITAGATPSSTSSYGRTVSDILPFAGVFFVTKLQDIVKATPPSSGFSGSWTLDESWWQTTKGRTALTSNAPHPMLVYENYLWVADGRNLHQIDSSLNIVTNFLQLDANDVINALHIDPGTGMMLISGRSIRFSFAISSADRLRGRNFIGQFDGYSAKMRRRIPVEGLVTAFQPVDGNMYVGYGNSIGLWNGSGVTFLRRLSSASTDSDAPITKQRLSAFENTLLVADGLDVLAYGEIQPGKKVWYPIFRNTVNVTNFGFIDFIGGLPSSPLVITNIFGTTTLRHFGATDTSVAGTGVYYSPFTNFDRPVNIRSIRIFTTGITTTAGIGGVSIIDDKGATTTPAVSTFVVASSESPKRVFDFTFTKQVNALQLKLTMDTQTFGITRALVYYDIIE